MKRIRTASCAIALALAATLLAACASQPKAPPTGELGVAIAYGRDLLENTPARMPHNVRARMSCTACHIAAGTVNRGGSFVGTYARFPQWNERAHRVITLQDRLAECFLYSMNGTPPAYDSKEMIAIVAYIAWLSRDTPTMAAKDPKRSFVVPLPAGTPDVSRGATLYASDCAMCHRSDGAGAGPVPPLWGATSFNGGAGMAHLNRMTGFVRYNMPANAPGTLALRDAYDISGYVLSHARPAFRGSAPVAFPAQPAKYF